MILLKYCSGLRTGLEEDPRREAEVQEKKETESDLICPSAGGCWPRQEPRLKGHRDKVGLENSYKRGCGLVLVGIREELGSRSSSAKIRINWEGLGSTQLLRNHNKTDTPHISTTKRESQKQELPFRPFSLQEINGFLMTVPIHITNNLSKNL